jgi:hypothetical protein
MATVSIFAKVTRAFTRDAEGNLTVMFVLCPSVTLAGVASDRLDDAALCTSKCSENDDPLYEAVMVVHPGAKALIDPVACRVLVPTPADETVATPVLLLVKPTVAGAAGVRDILTVAEVV